MIFRAKNCGLSPECSFNFLDWPFCGPGPFFTFFTIFGLFWPFLVFFVAKSYTNVPLMKLHIQINPKHFTFIYFSGQDAVPEGNCDFKSQKVWSFTWLILNVVALIGLFVVLGLFANLGWWSMTYDPTVWSDWLTMDMR